MSDMIDINLYNDIKTILNSARAKAYTAVNFVMVEAYWNIGKIIVESQNGENRAAYGSGFIRENFFKNFLLTTCGNAF